MGAAPSRIDTDRTVTLRRLSLLVLWLLAALTPSSATTQEIPHVIEEADRLYDDRRPAPALTLLEEPIADGEEDFELLWRASRAAFALGVQEDIPEVRDDFYRRAIDYAERAADLEPERTQGHYWLAASYGRKALHSGVGEKAELAGGIWERANRVLELDADHAGAHHVLGKLHFEIMDMSGFTRFMARSFMGNSALNGASWEDAQYHLERAVDIDPAMMVYRLDLARLYKERDEKEASREQLFALLDLPARSPFDEQMVREARELLEDLD